MSTEKTFGHNMEKDSLDLRDFGKKTPFSKFQNAQMSQSKLFIDIADTMHCLDTICTDITRCIILGATDRFDSIEPLMKMLAVRVIDVFEFLEPYCDDEKDSTESEEE